MLNQANWYKQKGIIAQSDPLQALQFVKDREAKLKQVTSDFNNSMTVLDQISRDILNLTECGNVNQI